MPRIRYLKPEFFTDEDLAELPYETRITYAGLWCYADKSGRLEDRPKFLKAMIFPYDNLNMEDQLIALSRSKHNGKPFIQKYEVEGQRLIQILNWDKHQKPHHTETDSKFPPIPPLELKGMEKGMEKQNNPSERLRNVQLTVKERLKNTDEYNCLFFNDFWQCYPKKIGKGKALEEWNKIKPKPDDKLTNTMKKVVMQFKNTEQWTKDNGQYIPNPSTWLHQKRWEDEPTEIKSDSNSEPKRHDDPAPEWIKEAIEKGWK